MSFLLRKLWHRSRKSNSEKEKCLKSTLQGDKAHNLKEQAQSSGPRLPNVTFTSHPISSHCDESETEIMVNQLAALAATVGNKSSKEPPSNEELSDETYVALAEEETFHYLTSLITVSYQQTPSHTPTASVSTFASKSDSRKSQRSDRRRAFSILSLHIDLPASSLSFPSLVKGSKKQAPTRYSPLPPPFVQKALLMRPEVRF
jgi:hypothetical protein